MKKLFFAIICFTLFSGVAMAANVEQEEAMKKLTEKFLERYKEGELPRGMFVENDSVYMNWEEFLKDSVSLRYFEQMGKLILDERAADTEMQVELQDMKMHRLPEEMMQFKQLRTNGPKKAVSIPQVSFYLEVPYTYMSIDGNNNPVRLSSIMYRPSPFQFNITAKLGFWNVMIDLLIPPFTIQFIEGIKGLWNLAFGYTFDYGVLGCHPTVTTSEEAPTGTNPLGKEIYMFCSDYALVVCPDYCGYGLSEYRQHPYLVQGITARNVVDGYIAALDLVKEKKATGASGSWKLADDFYTDIMGYSQGGSVALATLRYLESNQVSEENLKRINLRYTFCGDGPYSATATVQQYLDWSNMSEDKYKYMAYPCVLPLIVQAAKEAYNNDCMHTVQVEDFFTKEFLATGIIDDLDSKRVNTAALNEKAIAANTRTIDQIMSDKLIVKKQDASGKWINAFNTETKEYKCLMRALDYNDLTKGWTPHHDILFMHLDGDLVVPYCNMETVQRNMGITQGTTVVFTDPYKVTLTPVWSLAEKFVKKTLANPTHETVGEFFYMAAACGVFEEMIEDKK